MLDTIRHRYGLVTVRCSPRWIPAAQQVSTRSAVRRGPTTMHHRSRMSRSSTESVSMVRTTRPIHVWSTGIKSNGSNTPMRLNGLRKSRLADRFGRHRARTKLRENSAASRPVGSLGLTLHRVLVRGARSRFHRSPHYQLLIPRCSTTSPTAAAVNSRSPTAPPPAGTQGSHP